MTSKPPKAADPCVVDPAAVEPRVGSSYPANFAKAFETRSRRALGDAVGLTQFGVNLTTLEPGIASALRHWHTHEDEFVYVVEGELVLITDFGETVLKAGMGAGFPAGRADGHQLVNRSARRARYIEIGSRMAEDACDYPDVDLAGRDSGGTFKYFHKDGRVY